MRNRDFFRPLGTPSHQRNRGLTANCLITKQILLFPTLNSRRVKHELADYENLTGHGAAIPKISRGSSEDLSENLSRQNDSGKRRTYHSVETRSGRAGASGSDPHAQAQRSGRDCPGGAYRPKPSRPATGSTTEEIRDVPSGVRVKGKDGGRWVPGTGIKTKKASQYDWSFKRCGRGSNPRCARWLITLPPCRLRRLSPSGGRRSRVPEPPYSQTRPNHKDWTLFGGAEGARTLDLRRDRPAF